MDSSHSRENRPINILLHAVFLLSGTTTIIIGQILPVMSSRFSLNDLQAGYFFPAQFSGSLLGTYLTGWFGRNQKYIAATVLGCFLMAIGVLMMNSGSYYFCLFAFAVNGIGVGLTLPSINMLILEMNPLRPASALNILNFCWGLGAICCKPFIDTFTMGTSIVIATLLLAVPLVIAGVFTLYFGRGIERVHAAAIDEIASPKTAIWTTTLAWVLALFNFIHVGFESGVGGWLTTYSERIDYAASVRVLSPTFIFYVFFVVGRGVAPVYSRYLNENRSLLISLIVILFGMGITVTASSAVMLSVGAAISGFGTSSVFPTGLARFGRVFGDQAIRRAMPLFIAGTLGSIVATWLVGFLSNQAGNLRVGMYVLVVSIAVLMVLQIGLIRRLNRSHVRIS